MNKKTCTALFLMISAVAAGCSIVPDAVAEHPNVVVEAVEETNYSLAEVARGDIRLTQKIYFLYQQTKEEQLAFGTEDRRVVGVYAEVGDEVAEGQLLAELYTDDLEDDLASYQYQKERYELLNTQAKDLFLYDQKVLETAYDNGTIAKEEYDRKLEERKDSYDQSKEENDDALTILALRIAEVEEKMEGCRVYAGIDGVVTYLLPRLEGSTSDKDVTVCRIINSDECLFQMEDSEYGGYFEEGQKVYLKISEAEGYETTVTRIEAVSDDEAGDDSGDSSDGEDAKNTNAIVYLEPDEIDADLAVGTRCYYELLLDERTDVLYLPNRCVYQADDQAYVFVEDAGGMMSIRYISIGLQGDTDTEITGGLEEGDIVIRK